MHLHRTALAVAALLALAAPSTASAFTIGVGDRADAPVGPSRELGATTYRLVIDPAVPLATYDARIAAHRAVGQEPQIVVGGIGAQSAHTTAGVVQTAVAAAKRWPSAYSVGVVNEPDNTRIGVCEYARTFVKADRALRAVGVRRVPFGEWSPGLSGLAWQAAALDPARCKNSARALRHVVKRVSWHAYGPAIAYGPRYRKITRLAGAGTPVMHITEAGYIASTYGASDTRSLGYWVRAMRAVRRDRIAQIVVWGLHPEDGAWSSALIERNGRRLPAFAAIASAR